MPTSRIAMLHNPVEWAYTSGKSYADPCNEVTLDVEFTAPDGGTCLVPCFWAGGHEWRVRYAPRQLGTHTFRTVCSDPSNPDLHGLDGILEAKPYSGRNPLFWRGPLQDVAPAKTYIEHSDGSPFLWLADTWWMGLSNRLSWPDEFQLLAADRVTKGFSVIQIVAGLYPDMPAYDQRGFNEAGHPWEANYTRLNPGYFDMADIRIQHLVKVGLVPCIVGTWGYHLPWLGMDKMKLHWRNIIARWGAYPVVWCVAGEADMPFYNSTTKDEDRKLQLTGWTEVCQYVRAQDPYHRLISMHSPEHERNVPGQLQVLDFQMPQTGHSGFDSAPNIVKVLREATVHEPIVPIINSEVNYEGILEGSREEVQRFDFWVTVLLGAGFTYGANGIWQLNRSERPYGPSPHGASWGDTPWSEAYRLPGGTQVGLGKKLLERYPWWRFEVHPEWIDGAATNEHPFAPYTAGIPEQVRIYYFPRPIFPWASNPTMLRHLETGVVYRAFWANPLNTVETPLPNITANQDGAAPLPIPTVMHDWLLVLERIRA